jgi:hypothetical protein
MKKGVAGIIMPMIIISFSYCTSCTSCKDRSTDRKGKEVEMQQVQEIENKIEEKVYPLPTSAEVLKMLADFEVGYTIGITNPVENIRKYFISSKRALNLGGYGADLSYATLYNINQEVINYLDAIKSLSNDLNMSKIYDADLYTKIKDNFDNRDELVAILTGIFNETYRYLSENDQTNLALLVVGGAWVEGMYLTCHVTYAAYQFSDISKVLLEQKESFDTFIELAQPFSSDPSIGDFLTDLEPVKKVYEGIGTSLTQKQIDDLTKVINEVRAKVVD